MKKGTSLQGYVPLRRDPAHASEMVSQVLFGEQFRVLETRGDWHHISLDFDSYCGWVGTNAIHLFDAGDDEMTGPEDGYRMVTGPSVTLVEKGAKTSGKVILPAGAVLPGTSGKIVKICGREFELLSEDGIVIPGPHVDPEVIGMEWCSIPYLWGGRCGFGFDCSGLVQTLCRMTGIALPRDSRQQAEHGMTINFIHETRKGDLAFFENSEGEIAHVGMLMGGGMILHAYNSVRLDRFDQQGIFHGEKKAYTHKLRVVKRMNPDG
ncbi:MAG TPA: hypothetical protein ENO05_09015 [Bacteroides sp.]|nr:hypothetical protein [Bacteroides sp.]